MKVLSLIALYLVCSVFCDAQERSARRKVGDATPSSRSARLYVTPDPRLMPTSLKSMCALSSLIAVGVITQTLPAREPSPASLETDAVFQIATVLKGVAPTEGHIMITQRGGYTDSFVVQPSQYSLVKKGEQYLLFLRPDPRPTSLVPATEQRFLVTGVWTGMFRIQNGVVAAMPSNTDVLHSQYGGVSLDQIVEEVRTALK